jgi:hypothetical protein
VADLPFLENSSPLPNGHLYDKPTILVHVERPFLGNGQSSSPFVKVHAYLSPLGPVTARAAQSA